MNKKQAFKTATAITIWVFGGVLVLVEITKISPWLTLAAFAGAVWVGLYLGLSQDA